MRLLSVVICPSLILFASATAAAPISAIGEVQRFDDAPKPLKPARDRSESQEDRLHAVALYSTARLHERKRDFAKALRFYQRATRYDESNAEACSRAVELARELDRHSETARYAALLVEQGEFDSLNLLRAFVYYREQDQLDKGLKAYEEANKKKRANSREPAWVELHKLAGQVYLSRENFEEAANSLAIVDNVLSKPQEFGLDEETLKLLQGDEPLVLQLLIAESYLKAERFDKAKEAFAKAEKTSSDRGRRILNSARLHAAAGRTQKAIDTLKRFFDLKISSQGSRPYELLEQLLTEQKSDDLIGQLEELTKLDPDNAALGYFLGDKYLAAGQLESARQLFTKHIAERPQGVAYRALARIYQETDRAEEFLDLAAQLIERVDSLAIFGDQLKKASSDKVFFQALVKVAEGRLKKNADQFGLYARLAMAQLSEAAEDLDAAKHFYDLAGSVSDNSQKAAIYEALGMAYMAAEQYDTAAELFQKAIDENVAPRGNPIFHYYRAGALAMHEEYEDALADARFAAENSQDSPEFLNRVGWILNRADRRDDAIEIYERLIEQFGPKRDSTAIREAVREARLTLSHLYALNEKYAPAEELIEVVLDEFPDDRGAGNDLGYMWADRGVHLNRSLRMVQLACESEPDNTAYRDSLGWVYFRLGRYEDAVTELERAAKADDPDGVILDHLGDAYEKVGKFDQAVENWQKAIKAFEESGDDAMLNKLRAKVSKSGTADAPSK